MREITLVVPNQRVESGGISADSSQSLLVSSFGLVDKRLERPRRVTLTCKKSKCQLRNLSFFGTTDEKDVKNMENLLFSV